MVSTDLVSFLRWLPSAARKKSPYRALDPVFGLTAHTPLIYVKRGCWHSMKS